MNVLIVGSGGREHALAWKIAQSPLCDEVFVAPGNAGTAADATNIPIDPSDHESIIGFSQDNGVGLVVVGPEQPLVDGLVDAVEAAGLLAFGPSKLAAELEGSKAFCKRMLHTADIPTASYRSFKSADDAKRYVSDKYSDVPNVPLVVKADGLAAGKGVIVCDKRSEVITAIDTLTTGDFESAGKELVIEERLMGQEASVLAITDGETILTLPPAQDHKPAHDGDTGPNTGGMGAYCPATLIDDEMLARIESTILVPIVHAMKRGRRPFKGVLYAGLMMTIAGPKVLEFNVRFGDPECQPLLMRLRSDLLEIMIATARGRLNELADAPEWSMDWDPRPAVGVVMASEGYPGSYEKGRPIRGLNESAAIENTKVFHAGTKTDEDQIVNAGGRVLCVTALGDTLARAKARAYEAVRPIRWEGAWCRKDIADKGM